MSSPNPVNPTIEPITGALRIVNGQRMQDAAPCVVTLRPPVHAAKARRDERLFLLLNLTGQVSTHLYRELREVVAQTYWSATGSTMAALRLAAAAANRRLLQTNSRSVPADQCRASLVCAVLRAKDLFILQAGPAGACFFHEGHIRRFSRGEVLSPLGVGQLADMRLHHTYVAPGDKLLLFSPGLAQTTGEAGLIRVLGRDGIEEALDRLEQVGGGVDFSALLARWPLPDEAQAVGEPSSPASRLKTLAGLPEPRKWPWSGRRKKAPVETEPSRQISTRSTKVEPVAPSSAEPPERTAQPSEPPAPKTVEPDTAAPSSVEPPPRTVERYEPPPPEPVEERVVAERAYPPPTTVVEPSEPASPEPMGKPGAVQFSHKKPQPPSRGQPVQRPFASGEDVYTQDAREARPASPREPEPVEEPLVVERAYPFPATAPESVEPYERLAPEPSREPGPSLGERVEGIARSVGRGVAAAGGLVAGGASTLFRRTLPDSRQRGRRRARSAPPRAARPVPQENPAMMMVLAIGIPVVLAITVILAYRSLGADARFRALIQQAEEAVGSAQTAGGTSEASRSHWETALGHAKSAAVLRPDDQVATALQAQAQVALDTLDGIVRLQPVLLHDFGPSTTLRKLVIHGQMVFVLDPAAEWVSRLTLNQTGDSVIDPQGTSIVRMEQPIQDGAVGDLVDFVWVELAGGRHTSGLLILEQDGALVSYDPTWEGEGGTLYLQRSFLGMPPESPQLIDTYDGRLYILDTVLNQIRRYKPQGDTYPERPDHYFVVPPTKPLSEAVDMAIDGYIYLLYADGTVAKFLQGNPEVFEVRGVPHDLSQAVSLAVDADSGSNVVYVADRGNGRVVALEPDGNFRAQYYAGEAFDALEALAVDEAMRRLYVISGGRLYVAPLP